jgi:hypothetical protein
MAISGSDPSVGAVTGARATGVKTAVPAKRAISRSSRISSSRVKDLTKRTTEEVFLDHLELRKLGRLEDDIKRNYADDVMIISNVGTFFGHEGVRNSAHLLRVLLPTLKYKFDTLLIRGCIAFEEWEAQARDVEVHDGIDAFVMHGGKIKIQTIWYQSHKRKKAATRTRPVARTSRV